MAAKGKKINFSAEQIDCTAPVNKILDEFRMKNPLAYKLYCQVLRPRPAALSSIYHFTQPGYPLNTFDENWDGELNLDYFEPFPYRSLPPKMITPLTNMNKVDPVTIPLKEKYDWRKMSMIIKQMPSSTKVMESFEKLNEEVIQCQKHLVDIAAHLDSDPQPYLDSPYNWHYAGSGNLQLACVDWLDYLLHSQFTEVYLSEFNKDTLAIKMEPVASFDCGEGNNILETIYSPKQIVVLRTQHKIFILKLISKEENVIFEKLKCIKSELSYTSVAFDNFHDNILYITTLDYKLTIVNLDRMKARSVQLKGKVESLVDNWNTVVSSARGFYVHVGRRTVWIYDKRSGNRVHVWNDLTAISEETACNNISVAKHFEGSSSLYLGTDHHLFLMDIRFCHKEVPKVVQRWTHGMESSPIYLNHCNFDLGKELICLCSQWCEDMCVVPTYINRIMDTNSGGVTIPYRPPSIFSALNEAKQNVLQEMYNPLEPRLVAAITGNLLMERGENYDILMQNSFGDISCHTLFPGHCELFVEDDSAQKLREWMEPWEVEKKQMEVSSIRNIARFWKKLRKMPEGYKIFSYDKMPESKFDEEEIARAFDEEEVDCGLRDAWEGQG